MFRLEAAQYEGHRVFITLLFPDSATFDTTICYLFLLRVQAMLFFLSEICSGQRTRKIRFLTRFLRIIRTSTIISVTPSLSELHHQAFSAGTDEKLPCVSHILVALAFLLYCMQIMTHLSRILPNKPQSQSAIRN